MRRLYGEDPETLQEDDGDQEFGIDDTDSVGSDISQETDYGDRLDELDDETTRLKAVGRKLARMVFLGAHAKQYKL